MNTEEKREGTEAELWSGCSCHVHYFAFKRSSKSKSPKALNEAKEPKRERGSEKEREGERGGRRFSSCPPGASGRLVALTRFMSKINVN